MAFTANQIKYELKMIQWYLDNSNNDDTIASQVQTYSWKTEAQKLNILRNWITTVLLVGLQSSKIAYDNASVAQQLIIIEAGTV